VDWSAGDPAGRARDPFDQPVGHDLPSGAVVPCGQPSVGLGAALQDIKRDGDAGLSLPLLASCCRP
jgi:hypothetical protein